MGIPIRRDLGKPHSEQGQAEGSFTFEVRVARPFPSGRPLDPVSNSGARQIIAVPILSGLQNSAYLLGDLALLYQC